MSSSNVKLISEGENGEEADTVAGAKAKARVAKQHEIFESG
jgi:hypothetical protein